MILNFKKRCVETLKQIKQTRVIFRASEQNCSGGIRPWPASAEPFYALAGRCTARQESFGYILVSYDLVYVLDERAIAVLELCDGFQTAKEIKRLLQMRRVGEFPEGEVEEILAKLGKGAVAVWIPHSQLHIERGAK